MSTPIVFTPIPPGDDDEAALGLVLTPAEHFAFEQQGYLRVTSGSCAGRAFYIWRAGEMAWVYDNGDPVAWLSFRSPGRWPASHAVLTHKYGLEALEHMYLQSATWYTILSRDDPLMHKLARHFPVPA